jgi:hydrophobic/amphiphilic exporter-1 (mainly G- bacteria), HAE1 family
VFSKFFIHRPVFAGVVSIVIVLGGVVTMTQLPIALYPQITPPTVQVSASYPGADSTVVSETVAQIIEEQVNGVEGMLYMSSVCGNDGSYSLTVTFEVGTDLDMATVLVQNRVAIAEPRLPEEVRRQGVTTKKRSTDFVVLFNLYSPGGKYDDLFLGNYASIHLQDRLSRVDGVGEVSILGGSAYSMRIWLNPEKLKGLNLTTADVLDVIKEQNVQVAAGEIGQPPAPPGQEFQYTVTTMGRLSDPEQFGHIVLKTASEGRITRLQDVARIELGAQSANTFSQLNGQPTAAIAIYQIPGGNALNISRDCRAAMEDLARDFPDDLAYKTTFDSSWFVNASIREIVTTLVIAVTLVVLVVFLFLQDWRAAMVPAVAIPVSLIGTFIFMVPLGFSINILTMFGLVLAIGIVVDDAIVVVENCSRKVEEGKDARTAAVEAMNEITGAVIATTLVLLAVFVPTGFMGGITGRLYQQFALTISVSVCISTLNALTLSPALCGLLLRPKAGQKKNLFFRGFNRVFEISETLYGRVVAKLIRRGLIVSVLFVGLLAGTYFGFTALPSGFMPTEDQGYLVVSAQLPDAASLQRTRQMSAKVNAILQDTPGMSNYVSIGGYSMLDGVVVSNNASFVAVLERWDDRTKPSEQLEAILTHLRQAFSTEVPEASVVAFPPPSIPGLGATGGFQMMVENRTGSDLQTLQSVTQNIVQKGQKEPEVTSLYSSFRATVPRLHLDIDRTKVKMLGVSFNDLFSTLQTALGSSYVNDFNKFGKTYQVRVQAEPEYRYEPEQIGELQVRNADGNMLPIRTLVDVEESFGPQILSRYNLYPAAAISGEAGQGHSTGQAMTAMEDLFKNNSPPSMGFEWTGMAYQQILAGQAAPLILALAVVMVYLFLSAQYESFLIPLAVILSVPFAILGAAAATAVRAMDNNIYTQIGVVLLIGLASKSAILIVEFARTRRAQGEDRFTAVREASRLRFRAILMTAFSDILGWFPLVIAAGAGAASRQALGTAVFGGMIAATVIGLLFIPVLYVLVQGLIDRLSRKAADSGHTGQPGDS